VAPAAGYVAPQSGARLPQAAPSSSVHSPSSFSTFDEQAATAEEASSGFSLFAAAMGIGALAGWLNQRKTEVASVAAAAAVGLSAPMAANAMIDYEGVPYQGGTDIVDINNANVQAYRQFRGMFPTAAGFIATHGPYKEVADLYKIPQMPDEVAKIIKKYEKQFIVLPYNEAYGLDRINNGMYR